MPVKRSRRPFRKRTSLRPTSQIRLNLRWINARVESEFSVLRTMSRFQETTVRSELQSIGRTMRPPVGAEAKAQRRQTRLPWVWLIVGLIVVAAFIAALVVMGPTARLSMTPKESATFSALARHK